jgi:aminomethyltransferase
MVGLGARDSLRLEAGLCLYGHDLNETISPIEGTLAWTISKRRREQGGFLGYDVVKKQLESGVARKRVGFIAEGKLPPREGAELVTRCDKRTKVGVISSGAPSPSLGINIGMAYAHSDYSKLKTELFAVVRGKEIPVSLSKMPFTPAKYYKKPQ